VSCGDQDHPNSYRSVATVLKYSVKGGSAGRAQALFGIAKGSVLGVTGVAGTRTTRTMSICGSRDEVGARRTGKHRLCPGCKLPGAGSSTTNGPQQ
jgi:hypothetical protein